MRRGVVSGLILCAVGLVGTSRAQNPPASQKHAYIRFWNMLPAGPGNDLQLLAGEKATIAGASAGDYFADYLPAPMGSYTLLVKRLSNGTAVQRFPVILPENGSLTLLATEKNGQATVEMFNDTPDPKVIDLTARIVARQFAPGVRVTVSVAGVPPSPPLGEGDTAVLENIPLSAQTAITLQAVLPTQPPSTRTYTLTGDFTTVHRATLLLVADGYKRFRPRLLMDGYQGSKTAPDASGNP